MSEPLKATSKRFQDLLHSYKLDAKVIEFKELTRTAAEAATAIGCEIGQIAKTLIFKGKRTSNPICVIASGKNLVDVKRIELYVGEEIEKSDADFVFKHTGFVIGGVSPIGFNLDSKPIIDEDLMNYQELWAAAGTPHSVFCLSPQDLLKITQGVIEIIKK